MKDCKNNFESVLPEGYVERLHVNAKKTKVAIILNLISLGICAVVMGIAILALVLGGESLSEVFGVSSYVYSIAFLIFAVVMIVYLVLHELVHGLAYKLFTGQKLTFGLTWACAFCGVPHIYTYRKPALVAVLAPLVVFTLILIPIMVVLYSINPLYYLYVALLFGLHFGGCCGDIYVSYILAIRFKGKKLLMRDTGPEQFFYVYEGVDGENCEK